MIELGIDTEKIDLILDGGNVVKHHTIAIMTDKVFTENPGLTYEELQKRLPDFKQITIIPRDPHHEEIFGHADGMVRFMSEEHLLVNAHYDRMFKQKLHAVLNHAGFQTTELKVKEETKNSWGYINLYHIDDLIIQPAIDKANDDYIKG